MKVKVRVLTIYRTGVNNMQDLNLPMFLQLKYKSEAGVIKDTQTPKSKTN